MPRKKKGLKREHSEVAPAAAARDGANASMSLSRPSSERDASHAPTDRPQPSKRLRLLSDDDEDRLGRLVDVSRFLERIHQGRGAAVCVYGRVQRIKSTAAPDGPVCSVELDCSAKASTASTALTASSSTESGAQQPARLIASFHGALAHRVFESVGGVHQLGPPAQLFLSGFAAAAQPWIQPQQPARAEYRTGKAVLRFLPTSVARDCQATWIELFDGPPPRPKQEAVVAPLTNPEASAHRPSHAAPKAPTPSAASDSWFATPAPPGAPAAATRSPEASTSRTPAATTTAAQPTAAQPLRQPAIQAHRGRSASTVARSSSNGAASNRNKSPAGGAASSSSAAVARRSSNGPRHRDNLAMQPVFMLGSTEYTSLTALRNGQQANVLGIVISAGDPRRATGGSRDLNIKITIVDRSCSANASGRSPGSLNSSLTVMLFAQTMDRIAQPVSVGQVLLFRKIVIQDFSGKVQGVGKRDQMWAWALYDPVSGQIRKSPSFAQSRPLSDAEIEHMRSLAAWYGEVQGTELGLPARPIRPTLRLCDISENLFFDTTVEVLKVYTHSASPDLYVTDYTSHALFFRGTDHYLGLDYELDYPDSGEGWGHIFQIGLWDIHAEIAEALNTGDIIRIQNVRAKSNPRGMLVGGLGSAGDSGVKIKTLKASDESRVAFEKRRAEFIEQLRQRDQALASAEAGEASAPNAAADGETTSNCRGNEGDGGAERQEETVALGLPQPKQEVDDDVGRRDNPQPNDPPPPRVQTKVEDQDGSTSQTKSSLEFSLPTPGQRPLHTERSPQTSQPGTESQESSAETSGATVTVRNVPLASTPLPIAAKQANANARTDEASNAVSSSYGVIRCRAPSSIPYTPLSALLTTSTNTATYKVKGRVASIRPERLEEWARIECTACKRLLPLEELFCTRCGEEDGEGEANLRYTFRFALLLEEVEPEPSSNAPGESARQDAVRIPILFNEQAATSFLPGIEPRQIHAGSKSMLRKLMIRIEALLGRPLTPPSQRNRQESQEAKGPVVRLAIYTFSSVDAGKPVRRFAGLRNFNVLLPPP
ncbi:hypothetical protein ACQY0O_002327 [Thecaphora frezii]